MADADFNASGRKLVIPNGVLKYERTQAWTAFVVFKHGSSAPPGGGASIIFSNVGSSPYPGYELWVNDQGKLHVRIINTFSTNYIGKYGGTNIADNAWHVVVVTYDGSSTAAGVKIYLDGVEESYTTEADTLSASIATNAGNFVIGNQTGFETTYYFRGSLREFGLYNVVKDATFISNNSATSASPAVDADTQLRPDFGNVVYLYVQDRSANAYEGTLSATGMLMDTSVLINNLISYWRLNESSGNALDAYGTNTLTDNNSVGATTGKINGARSFATASSRSLTHADSNSFDAGVRGLTCAAWVKFDSITGIRPIFAKDDVASNRQWGIYWYPTGAGGDNRVRFYASSNGTGTTEVSANSFGAISTATWYYIVGWFDLALGLIGISINDVSDTISFGQTLRNGTAGLELGGLAAASLYHDGAIDAAGLWQRTIGPAQRTSLYNSGNGDESWLPQGTPELYGMSGNGRMQQLLAL